jgi:outer membrane protein OmpA-like peptidoglycan-associated protein
MRTIQTIFLAAMLSGAGLMPAAAQAPFRSSVYFGWNEFELSGTALAVVEEAIRFAKACNLPRVDIVGHDDTSLSSERAQTLSDQRAESVRRAMIDRGGISPEFVTSEGRGDREPFLPTRDGVQEALNRRVEIDIICR